MSEGFTREALILRLMTDIRNLEAKTPVDRKHILDLAQEVADAVDGKRKHPHHAKEVADHAPGKG